MGGTSSLSMRYPVSIDLTAKSKVRKATSTCELHKDFDEARLATNATARASDNACMQDCQSAQGFPGSVQSGTGR